MTVQLTILIMASNVPAVVVSPLPSKDPIDQDLAWIGFGTEDNCNNICGLEVFNDFFGLIVSNI